MKQPTHPEYNDIVGHDQPVEGNVIEYLLNKVDEEKAKALLVHAAKTGDMDSLLATMIYAVALAVHESLPDREKDACAKAMHLGNFLHVLVHEMYEFDDAKGS